MTKMTAFEHCGTVNIPDPDFMPIFLYPCGPDHVIAIQNWCAFLIDPVNKTARRVDFPSWAWNVGSTTGDIPALTIFDERKRSVFSCPIDRDSGKVPVEMEELHKVTLPTAEPPILVTEKAVWFARSGKNHSLIATRHDRVTDLSIDISRIAVTDFFLQGPIGEVYLHKSDVGLIDPNVDVAHELVVNYRKIGCNEPMGASFDPDGRLWVLDENGPVLFKVDTKTEKAEEYDINDLHEAANDPTDPSPYPWHSCIWHNENLLLGCCDASRIDILRLNKDPV